MHHVSILIIICLSETRGQTQSSQQCTGFKFMSKFILGTSLGQQGIIYQVKVLTLRLLSARPQAAQTAKLNVMVSSRGNKRQGVS